MKANKRGLRLRPCHCGAAQGGVSLVFFCSHPAPPQQKWDHICHAKGSAAFSQRPDGCCLLLLVLAEVQWMLNNSVLFRQHLRGSSPCKALAGAALGAASVSVRGCKVDALTLLRVSTASESFHSFR